MKGAGGDFPTTLYVKKCPAKLHVITIDSFLQNKILYENEPEIWLKIKNKAETEALSQNVFLERMQNLSINKWT